MCHVTDRQCGAFSVLVFHAVVFLVLIHSCSGQSEPIGPSQPIVAMVGDDTVLPCQLVPVMNAFVMTVEWARQDLEPRFVLLWRDGVELASKKHPSYRGRTSLFTDRLEHGDASLKLSSVRISDEGRYRCFIPGLHKSPTVQLDVGAVSSPQILMNETSNGSVLLQCDAKGWYPEPEVVWLDGEGDHVPAGPAETLRGPDGLYAVSSSLTVEKRRGNFTCRVLQRTTNQTRETHVQVADRSFMVSPHVLIGFIIGGAALVFIPVVLFVVWKQQQKKRKTKRRSPEDGPEPTEEVKEVPSNRDNTGSQDGEHVSLLAEIEEEDNEFELIQSDQLVTKPDGEDKEENNVESRAEEIPLIPTERETHQKQDMKNEGEGGQTMKPVTEDSGLPLVLVEDRQKEQQLNVQAAQEVQEEEETNQAPMNNVDKEVAKKKNKKERVKKVDSGRTEKKKLQENRKERKQQEVERRRRQTVMQEREEMKEDNIELKPWEGKEHLLEDQKQEGSNAEHEDTKVKDQEVNQRNITGTKEENQKEKQETREVKDDNVKESKEQENIRMDEEKIDLKTMVGDTSKQEADQKGNQSNINTMTESLEGQINEESKESEMERGDRETPSVSREVTARPDQEVHLETTTGRQNLEEKELQPEEQQEEEPQRNQEESTKGVKGQRLNVEQEIREQPELLKLHTVKALQHQEASQAEPMEVDSSPQTQRDVNRRENRKQREQEKDLHVNLQQTDMKRRRREDRRAKTQETFKKLKERLGKREIKELLREREIKELLREREIKELLREQEIKELLREREPEERLGEQNGDPMEFKEGTNTEQEVRNEPQVWDWNPQQDQDQAPMGQEDKREEQMEF